MTEPCIINTTIIQTADSNYINNLYVTQNSKKRLVFYFELVNVLFVEPRKVLVLTDAFFVFF